jgi:hypothetical protein
MLRRKDVEPCMCELEKIVVVLRRSMRWRRRTITVMGVHTLNKIEPF